MILAIDTATDQASVALLDDDVVRAELSWVTRGNHSTHLARVLPELLRLAECSYDRLTALAVTNGPGSFNGIRVGVSVAKGMALALRLPLVGISTLDVIAWQAAEGSKLVWAVLPAGRQELYLGRFYDAGSDWRRVGDYERLTADLALEQWREGILLAGDLGPILAPRLAHRIEVGGRTGAAHSLRRAGYLAELGKRYFASNGVDQADTLEPLYLRRSSAEENRLARQGE